MGTYIFLWTAPAESRRPPVNLASSALLAADENPTFVRPKWLNSQSIPVTARTHKLRALVPPRCAALTLPEAARHRAFLTLLSAPSVHATSVGSGKACIPPLPVHRAPHAPRRGPSRGWRRLARTARRILPPFITIATCVGQVSNTRCIQQGGSSLRPGLGLQDPKPLQDGACGERKRWYTALSAHGMRVAPLPTSYAMPLCRSAPVRASLSSSSCRVAPPAPWTGEWLAGQIADSRPSLVTPAADLAPISFVHGCGGPLL